MQQASSFFSYTCPHPITRLQPNASLSSAIAVEMLTPAGEVILGIYDLATHQFACSSSLPVYYKLVQFEGNYLLLQSYAQLDQPHAPDFMVYNAKFELCWQLAGASMLAVTAEAVGIRTATGAEAKLENWYNISSGKAQPAPLPEQVLSAAGQLPMQYPEGTAEFATVAKFIQQQLKQKISLRAEYAHVFGKILISYYTEVGKLYRWHFAAFNEQGSLCYKNVAQNAESAPGSTTFMIWNAICILLPNQTTLAGYPLNAEGL